MYKYIIESNKLITKNILSLRLRAKNETDIFGYLPGQYAAIGFKRDGRLSPMRCFSFAGSPTDRGFLEFGIRVGGVFTQNLVKLQKGDEIFVMGPYGEFILDPRKVGSAVFFAGGIGITPFVSIIRTAIAEKWPTNLTLLYSSKTLDDAAYAKELYYYHQKNPNFNLFLFASNEDLSKYKSNIFLNGPIDQNKINQTVKGRYGGQSFYLCGPPPFMAAMKNNLLAQNVNYTRIISEEFSSSGNKDSSEISVQSKVNRYVWAGLAACLVFVIVTDTTKTISKLNVNQGGVTQGTSSLINNSNTSTSSDNTSNSNVNPPSDTSSSSQPTTNNSFNNYSTSSTNQNSSSNLNSPSSSSSSNQNNTYVPPSTRRS